MHGHYMMDTPNLEMVMNRHFFESPHFESLLSSSEPFATSVHHPMELLLNENSNCSDSGGQDEPDFGDDYEEFDDDDFLSLGDSSSQFSDQENHGRRSTFSNSSSGNGRILR